MAVISFALTMLSPHPQLWEAPLTDSLQVSRPFDLPDGPYQAGHRGIDLTASEGSPVHSPRAGTVSFAGVVAQKPVISIRVDAETVVSFEPVTTELKAGDLVQRGQIIGVVSHGGHCAHECLHVGVRINGDYVNPLRFFWPKPVLLPW